MEDRKVRMQGMLGEVLVGMLGNGGEYQGMLRNVRKYQGVLGNDGECQGMFRNNNVEMILKKEDRYGRQEGRNVGNVGKGMDGNVRECWGRSGNVEECQGMFRNDNVENIFQKKDRDGRQEGRNVGNVGNGMQGIVREC